MNMKKRYSDNVNYNLNIILMTNPSYFLWTNYRKKSKHVDSIAVSQQARPTTIVA